MVHLLKRIYTRVFRTRGAILVLAAGTLASVTPIEQVRPGSDSEMDIAALFPSGSPGAAWQPADSVRVFRGEELFEFINGGAPIFLEYGFRQAAMRRYALQSGLSLICEVYEMEGPASAYGIFTFQTVDMHRGSALGDGAVLAEYYVTFWKGRYLITITGDEESAETRDAIMRLALAVEARVEQRGAPPELVRSLPADSLGCEAAVYIRGSLGLYNNFVFDAEDIFGVEEGIVAQCPGARLVVLRYDDDAAALDRFNRGRGRLEGGSRFTELRGEERLLLLRGTGSSSIRIEPFRRYLLLAKGDDSEELGLFLLKVKNLLPDELRGPTK